MTTKAPSQLRNPLNVLMDVGPAVHQSAGLARYTERLASQLLATWPDSIRLTLLYNAHHGHRLPASLRTAQSTALPLGQYLWRLSILAGHLMHRPHDALGALCDRLARHTSGNRQVYHATEHILPNLRVPTVLTVHDLIFERQPKHHTWKNRLYLKVGMPLFARAATAIIAVSQNTRNDIVELYRIEQQKIHVIYEGVDDEFQPQAASVVKEVRNRYSPDAPYLLMVGTLEPRKNHMAAVRAVARLRAHGYPHRLLIGGGQGWLFEPIRAEIERLGLDHAVRYLGYVPEPDLPALYAGADCAVAPSLYEGFGLTVLEAMACATPIVCSNVSSLPEITAGAALYVPPTDHEALANSVARILTEPGLRTHLIEQGLRRAAHFRWQVCARHTAELYGALTG